MVLHPLFPFSIAFWIYLLTMINKKRQTRSQQHQKRHENSTDVLYQPTDIVLAKVKGYPAWPAMIIPNEIIPTNVLKSNSHIDANNESDQASKTDNNDSDNYSSYSKILKFKKFDKLQDSYCVKFFKDDSYIWVRLNDLQKLSLNVCQDWLKKNQSSGKNKRLIPAYEMACQGFRSPGIDVWEFVEYGSKNRKTKVDDEEYIDEDQSSLTNNDNNKKNKNTNLHSIKTRSKDKSLNQEKSTRSSTRSSTRQRQLHSTKTESDNQNKNILEENIDYRSKRTRNLKKQNPSSSKKLEESSIEISEPPKKKTKTSKNTIPVKPVVEKYNYEDDEDWSIVGMGPQNYDITSKISTIVTKLAYKNKLEEHNEIKMDLTDKLMSMNKLFIKVITETPKRDDYEIILDELDIVLKMNGSKNEFISVLRGNNELLINFRILFNMKLDELHRFELYDNFQKVFKSIYNCFFIPDLIPWSKDKSIDDTSETNNEDQANN